MRKIKTDRKSRILDEMEKIDMISRIKTDRKSRLKTDRVSRIKTGKKSRINWTGRVI